MSIRDNKLGTTNMDPLSTTSHCFVNKCFCDQCSSHLCIQCISLSIYPWQFLGTTNVDPVTATSSCFVNLFVISVASVYVSNVYIYLGVNLISSLSSIHNDFSLATQMWIQSLRLLLFCLNCLWLVSQAVQIVSIKTPSSILGMK